MPLYEVNHTTPLSPSQQEQLANKITYIHSRQFTTPSLFVNVVFKDTSQFGWYVGGKKRSPNTVLAHVRPGGGRSNAAFEEVAKKVAAAWDEVLKPNNEGDKLRAVFMLGTIVAGYEAGFSIPQAGEDKNWLADNIAGFKDKVKEGDEDFADMLKELETRDDLKAPL